MAAPAPPGPSMLPALPALRTWTAPEGWRRIDFVSDLHLSPHTPRGFDAFAAHLRHTPADAVVILGDLFEVWVGDDQRGRDFERRCVELLAAAAQRLMLAFMPGNRDFLVGDAMGAACGWTALPDPTLLDAWGRRVLLSHGDVLCIADVEYQRFRALSRTVAWQRGFLALPLAERLRQAGEARAASEARKRATGIDPELWADVDTGAALAWLREAGAADLVHGHTHRPGRIGLDDAHRRHVLTDWVMDPDGERAEVLCLTREGLSRVPPSAGPAS